MKLLSVAACIFLLITAACGDKAPAKNDGDNAPAKKDSSTHVQDTSTDEVTRRLSPAEDKMVSENEAEESDDETEDVDEDEDEDETRDDQEFDDDIKTIGADKAKDAIFQIFTPRFWRREGWTFSRRRCKHTCVGKNRWKCKCKGK